jgi:hypothetical protein
MEINFESTITSIKKALAERWPRVRFEIKKFPVHLPDFPDYIEIYWTPGPTDALVLVTAAEICPAVLAGHPENRKGARKRCQT